MSLFKLPRKNVFETWWRSFSLGSFVFLATVMLLFFNSFITTAEINLQTSMINSLTGDIQLRPGDTEEEDMFSLNGSWGDAAYMTSSQVEKVEKVLDEQIKPDSYTKRIRHNVMLAADEQKQPAMLMGLDLKSNAYQESFLLEDGRYLDPNNKNEVLISKTYATKLEVKVGDEIDVLAQTKDKQPAMIKAKVVGIGDVERLSSFSFFPVYMDLEGASELIGFKDGEITDIVTFIPDRNKAADLLADYESALKAGGVTTADVKLSTWEDMGGFLMGLVDMYIGMFYGFVGILLLIIGILIVNLILMMGLERRNEIGTLRAIGFSRSRIIWIFMTEIFIITTLFFLAGLIVGVSLILILAEVGINAVSPMDMVLGKEFFMQFDPMQILPVVGIIYGFTLLASFYPSFRAASIRPAETLREA